MAAALILLAGSTACFFPQQFLTIDSGPVKADAMVILGGAWLERPDRAVELFKQQAAPRVLVSGFGECNYDQRMLVSNGVPAAAIALEPCAHTTLENAKFSIPMLRALGAKRVIIVTSWYHSRRALACFAHYAPDIQFYSRPSYYGFQKNGRDHVGISCNIEGEYRKLFGYWVCYGVCPL